MALGMVLDPTATRTDDIASPGPDAGMLIGKRVGFRLDRMWRAWDWISELWAQRFQEAGAEVSFWRSGGRSCDEGDRMEPGYKEFLATIHVTVLSLPNSRSCPGRTGPQST